LILYQDSNSIVKQYIRDEHGLTETHAAVGRADVVSTSLISYPEVRSALNRARLARRLTSQAEYGRYLLLFERDWSRYFRLNLNNSIVRHAGDLAERHSLKGADSIHLAQAIARTERTDDSLEFSTWDKRLAAAAEAEGLSLAHEVTN
jgi:uncharacterized protein